MDVQKAPFDWGKVKPHTHQVEVVDDFYTKFKNNPNGNYNLIGSMGCGKGILSAACTKLAIEQFEIERVLVLSPSLIVKHQIVDEYAMLGLELSSSMDNRRLVRTHLGTTAHGASCTFPQVNRLPELFRNLCSQKPTIGICDEIQFLGLEKSWGEAVKYALEPCKIRFGMTGTMFRTDNRLIPFVNYRRVK